MIEVAVDGRARLGECPLRNSTEQVLYPVDIERRAIRHRQSDE